VACGLWLVACGLRRVAVAVAVARKYVYIYVYIYIYDDIYIVGFEPERKTFVPNGSCRRGVFPSGIYQGPSRFVLDLFVFARAPVPS
jgi:hypothetical protein